MAGPDAHLGQRLAAAERHGVIVEDDGGGPILGEHYVRRHLVAAGLVDEAVGDQAGVDFNAVPLQRLAIAVQEQVAEVEIMRRADGSDAAMAARD